MIQISLLSLLLSKSRPTESNYVVLLVFGFSYYYNFNHQTRKSSFTPKPIDMKLFSARLSYVTLIAVCSFLLWGCQRTATGKIPFNEERARQQIIPVRQGSQYSLNFVNLRDSVLPQLLRDSSFLEKKFNLPIAETFNRDAIIALLNADNADGIRVYFGNDEKGLVRLVLTPVDKDGNDIVTKLTSVATSNAAGQAGKAAVKDGEVVENGQRPPPPSSALNYLQ